MGSEWSATNCSRQIYNTKVNKFKEVKKIREELLYLIHWIDRARMGPETVVNGCKGDPLSLAEEGRQHHVTRIQRMNKIGWKAILLLQTIWFTVNFKENCFRMQIKEM